jgi:hypothetical protein
MEEKKKKRRDCTQHDGKISLVRHDNIQMDLQERGCDSDHWQVPANVIINHQVLQMVRNFWIS